MKQNCPEQIVDVRPMPSRKRHPAIFNTWKELPEGGAILLVNDHDPLPLFYQFAAEQTGRFRWDYLQQGPEVWEVRISKGDFADPGFVPTGKVRHACTSSSTMKLLRPLVLDTRPIFARGDTPCDAIDSAVTTLVPGQPLVLLVPFEPVPLYAKLQKQGFSHKSMAMDDGSWRVEFRKSA